MAGPRRIVPLLHHPIAPYFSDAYTSLISASQSVALGVVVLVVNENICPSSVLQGVAMLALIFTVWHRYVIHVQYVGWRFGPGDTLIPMAFGVVEVATALTIPRGLPIFLAGTALTAFVGFWALMNIVWRQREQAVRDLFRHHFQKDGIPKSLGDDLWIEIKKFSLWSAWLIALATVLFGALAGISFIAGAAFDRIMTWVACVVIVIVACLVTFFDLRRHLRRSTREAISQFWW